MSERERERGREREGERGRERERERERGREREGGKERERQTDREGERQREREKHIMWLGYVSVSLTCVSVLRPSLMDVEVGSKPIMKS